MGIDLVVEEIVSAIGKGKVAYSTGARSTGLEPETREPYRDETPESEAPGINERVKFWEEQDKINEVLIPRVIRQSGLLAEHVSDHENLQVIAAKAAYEATEATREELHNALEAAQGQKKAVEELLEESRQERQRQQEAHENEIATIEGNSRKAKNIAITGSAAATALASTAVILTFVL